MAQPYKKRRERFFVERLREVASLNFEINDSRKCQERPDFLLRYQGGTISLEVAELQIDQGPDNKRGSPLQTETSLRRKVVSIAQESYFAVPSPSINASVYFESGPGQSLEGIKQRDLARKLSAALRELTLEPFEQLKLDQHSKPSVPLPIGFVYALGIPEPIIPTAFNTDPCAPNRGVRST